jgi:hypothetical protein
VTPNTTNTGSDLKINGKDYFEYVFEVNVDEVADERIRKEKGLSKSNTSLIFRLPSQPTTAQRCPMPQLRENEFPQPLNTATPAGEASIHKPMINSPIKPIGPSSILEAGRRLTSSNKYQEFEDEDSFN